ncbi:ABC transporter ATP-binding protein [Pseudonocardia acaciae]|uniref:ABC transporter ATP-binding protein n=1 Tax=Pseudonocardia acaciae TaxID=551276 RepID=UPI000688B788|nr:ABC transporter ATP-binding protein [Pseudonocardia acaciae]
MSPTEAKAVPGTSVAGGGESGPAERAPARGDALRLVARFAGVVRGPLVVAVVLAVVAAMFELLPYWLVYSLVRDLVAGNVDERAFLAAAAVGVVAVVGQYTLFGAAMTLSHRAAFGMLYEIRMALARRLGRLPLGYFTRTRSGEVKRVLNDGTERIELVVAHALPDAVAGAAVWLGVSIWMFAVDWRLALASAVAVPAAFACMGTALRVSRDRLAPFLAADARMNGSIVEYLAGMPVVKVFNRTGEAFTETSRAVRDYTDQETAWARAWVPLGGAFYTLILANIVVILPVGLGLLRDGAVDVATLLFFVIVGAHYSRPLLKLFAIFAQFAHIAGGAREITAVLEQPELPDTGRRPALAGGDVEFDRVGFAYGDREVLHEVSFTARGGQVTALVGPSGAGKTTIARLVPRFADVTGGSIRVGGHDVREIGIEALMDAVAFVFQDTFLFDDTVAANIRVGRADASDDDVVAAARLARCDEFVSALPAGYDTVIGERGAMLSGGERQRVTIARAILKNAPIVVLDEATAFVDPDNEAAIQDAISALARGRTVLVVAHRLSTIVGADQILVVDGGRVVESGRHDDLVAANGTYARLWNDFVDAQSVVLHR